MSNFQVFTDNYNAKETLSNLIAPPVDGGTIDLVCVDGGVVVGNTASNETWYLPDEDNVPIQTTVYISNESTGKLTIKNGAGTTIDTVTGSNDEIKEFILSASREWVASGSASPTFDSVNAGQVNVGQYLTITPASSFSGITIQGVAADSTYTQASLITDAVAITRPFGSVTTVSSTLSAGTNTAFNITNALIGAKSIFLISASYAGTTGTPLVFVSKLAASTATITIHNLGAAPLNGAITINYAHIVNLTS
jgi:hypothetical protein